MTKPKCKTCVRLRQEAKADADFIADMICKHYNELIELKKQVRTLTEQNNYLHWRLDACRNEKSDGGAEEIRLLKARIEHLNGEILKQPFTMPWRTEPVERPKTAFIIENPVITFPPGTIIDGGIAQLPDGKHLYW